MVTRLARGFIGACSHVGVGGANGYRLTGAEGGRLKTGDNRPDWGEAMGQFGP